MRKSKLIAIFLVIFLGFSGIGFAQKTNIDILRQGLLGAGTGAIASSVSGANGDDVWIGALTGAGVNIIGGSLLDVLTTPNTGNYQNTTYSRPPQRTYRPQYRSVKKSPTYARKWYYKEDVVPVVPETLNYGDEIKLVYQEGYKDGYIAGYKDAIKDYTGKD